MKPFRLDRRALLRGAGVAIALPTLDAMLDGRGRWFGERLALAATTTPPVRVMAFHFPHGVVLRNFTPSSTGTGYQITRILTPLAAHQNDFNVISGLDQDACRSGVGGGHARGMPCFASASVSNNAGSGGASFDQVLAAELGSVTKFRSIVANNQQPGTITEGATTAHMNNISWSAAGKFVPADRDPKVLFSRLVSAIPAGGTNGPAPVDLTATHADKRSVLDHVTGELSILNGRVGAADRARLDDYLSGLREVERSLAPATPVPMQTCSAPADVGVVDDFALRARVFLRLIAMAFQCDLTRYASFALSNGFDTHVYPDVSTRNSHHHDITHTGDNYGPDNGETETKFAIYYMEFLAYLLDQLKASSEGAGSVLDNSLIYFGSEMAEGWHTIKNMPVVLAGRAGGKISTGRHITLPGGTPMARLFLTILQAAGSQTQNFGMGGNAPLAGISA